MNNFGSYQPSIYLAPNAPLSVVTGVGWEYIKIENNSTYQLNITPTGMASFIFPEFYVKDIYLPSSYRGSLIIQPIGNVSSVGHSVSNLLTLDAYQPGEIGTPTSQALAQPAVTTTATGKPIFSATFGWGPTVTNNQGINIFNPPASGVVATFHSARVYTNDATGPSCNLIFLTGADQNWNTPVNAISHTGIANAPISVMHCTSQDGGIGLAGSLIEVINVGAMVETDMLAFPDDVLLYPGGNMYIEIASGSGGHVVRETLKWTEDVVTPYIPVKGAVNVASSIKNDGNVAGTQVIESTVLGDGSSAVIITNDAQVTFGDAAHNAVLTILGNLLETGNITLTGNETFSGTLTPTSGGKYNSQSGHTLQDWNFGVANANLTIAVTHGLKANGVATAPTAILITSTVGGNVIFVNTVTTTQFTINSNVAQNVFWLALLA
jgi:hypothetical protein